MLMIISPAKSLDFDTPASTEVASQPDFLAQSQRLIQRLRELAPADIAELMSISDKLAMLNYERFQHWQPPFSLDNAKQALLAFTGDVYTGINAPQFAAADLAYAQQHLRILSGLYGLLRPLDLIQPYRLEMGTRLASDSGANLYQFWGSLLTEALNRELAASAEPVLLNLASNEYYKVLQPKAVKAEIITPVFKDWKAGKYKIVSFYAKKARGMMAAYVIRNRIEDVEQLKQFDAEGYAYQPAMSGAGELVFCRRQAS